MVSAAAIARFLVEDQSVLLQEAVDDDEPLGVVLRRHGWAYDDLVYERHRERVWRGGAPPSLNDFGLPGEGPPFVSFFTGCGGMDLGFEAAGFRHVAAFEHNELFCSTLRKNRPDWNVFGPPYHDGDVSKFEDIRAALSGLLTPEFEGVFVGGPPCQPFSIAANQRFSKSGAKFKRIGFSHAVNGNLLFDYVSLIEHFKPRVFVIENVPGLRDLDNGEQLREAVTKLAYSGYNVDAPFVVDAANYSVPQQRQRLFVIGARGGVGYTPPGKSHLRYGAGSVLDRGVVKAANHDTREHKVDSILRYMRLRYGERDQLGRVDRLDPLVPSKTVIAGGTNGGGRSHLHPEIPRTLSVRECARLQTFPDDYVFIGASGRQFTQVGNAVPPVLAAQIAASVRRSFYGD